MQFVSFVLDDVQKTWEQKLQGYRHAKLVLFRDVHAVGLRHGAVGDRAVLLSRTTRRSTSISASSTSCSSASARPASSRRPT